MRLRFFLSIAVILTAVSMPAHADDLFTLTNGSDSLTFTLPASPTPTFTGSPSCDPNYADSFCFTNLPIDIDGITTNEAVNFYGSDDGGGLVVTAGGPLGNILNQYGPQLYTGLLTSPTFTPGYYLLTDGTSATDPSVYTGNYDLTIAATPEPSSLILLGTGLLGMLVATRRKLFI